MTAVANVASVRCNSVGKIFGPKSKQFEAIRSVDFEAKGGEFVSLLGPSGCGKTTVLMITGGLELATTGQVTVGERVVEGPSSDVGIMFQDATLLPWKTALENVLFPIRIMKRPVAKYRGRAEELLRLVGLGNFIHKKPLELSGGMRQRVALCRALIHEPRVLLMDEPFSALDAITRDEMAVVLSDMWAKFGSTALFVTHSIREAVFLSDRVIVMGQQPATIVEDLRIDFPRPRNLELHENSDFNRICAHLRGSIETAHHSRRSS